MIPSTESNSNIANEASFNVASPIPNLSQTNNEGASQLDSNAVDVTAVNPTYASASSFTNNEPTTRRLYMQLSCNIFNIVFPLDLAALEIQILLLLCQQIYHKAKYSQNQACTLMLLVIHQEIAL